MIPGAFGNFAASRCRALARRREALAHAAHARSSSPSLRISPCSASSSTSTSASIATTPPSQALGWANVQFDTFFRVVLPLGISFYTFQALSYTIDVYRGEAEAMANFVDFSCFVSMFPHLVAGPILKFSFLAEQLKHRTLTLGQIRARRRVFHARPGEENPARESVRKNSRHRFRCRLRRHARRVVRLGRLLVPDLFRFQRLLRHGDRARAHARVRFREEFRFALSRGIDHRFLAALAHLALHLAARISLHSAGRKSRHALAHLRQPRHHDVARRALARRVVEFRHLGRDARRDAGVRTQPGARRLLSQPAAAAADRDHVRRSSCSAGFSSAPPICRAPSLISGACSDCIEGQPGAALISGIIYQPYYLLSVALAALVVWAGKQTWDWTQQLTLPKAAVCCGLGWLALVVLATQEYNPFIYFIF